MLRKNITFLMTLLATASSFVATPANANSALPIFDYYPDYVCCDNNLHFFFRGDLLVWKPCLSGLNLYFGRGSIDTTTTSDGSIIRASEYDADASFDWNTGYRIGGGVGFWDNYELGAFYTHFHGRGNRYTSQNNFVTNSGSTKTKLQQLDVVIAYNNNEYYDCDPCNTTYIKPFVGIRYTRINDSLNAYNLTDLTILEPGASPSEGSLTRIFNDNESYKGVGPIFGVEGQANIWCNLNLYGAAAVGILYGDYSLNFKDKSITTIPTFTEVYSCNSRHAHSVDYNVDEALGLLWETTELCAYKIQARAGLEHHQYFNHNRLGFCRGDLTFSGGIFSLGIAI